MTTTPRPHRTWIITPGLRTERFPAARTCGADVALVDLEDSVAARDKPTARAAAHQFFRLDEQPACSLGMRMNSPTTPDGARDLVAIADFEHKPDVILIPKVESGRDLEIVAGVLDTNHYRPQLWALIETPRAFTCLPSIVRAPRLAGVIFGSADYAAALGCDMDWQTLVPARSALVTAAAAAGLPAVDAPSFDLNDLDGLRREAQAAKRAGFHGKGVVHTRHVPIVKDVFAPSAQDIAQARAIVEAGRSSGSGITSVGGQMVGTPFFARAQALLAEADADALCAEAAP